MKIKGKMGGQVRQIVVKVNKTQDGQVANADFVVRVTPDECIKRFGEDFARVAFGGMIERETDDGDRQYVHLVKKPKPTKELVMEIHDVKAFGGLIKQVQPSICAEPVQGEPKVDVVLRIPVTIGESDAADIALLRSAKSGTATKVEFRPKQGELDFEAAKKAKDEQAAA